MRTPLFEEHVKLKAHIVDFHGWEMPLYYDQIISEHMAVRNNLGIFDVSHMGDIIVTGKDSSSYLDGLFPTMVSKLSPGSCAYTAFTNEEGNMIDDCIVYRLSQEEYLIVPNAATKDKIFSWMKLNKGSFNVNVDDVSDKYGCIAVQGPKSQDLLLDCGLPQVEFFKWINFEWKNNSKTIRDLMIISGTGYTGEKGVEIIADNQTIVEIWKMLVTKLGKYGGKPCGLGARDTLRMEKGMLLSGTDFNTGPLDKSKTYASGKGGRITSAGQGTNFSFTHEQLISSPWYASFQKYNSSKDFLRLKIYIMLSNVVMRVINYKRNGCLCGGSIRIKIGQEVRVKHAGKFLRGMISKPRMFPLEIPLPPS